MEKKPFEDAGIQQCDWPYCHIADEKIYTPVRDGDGNLLMTGEEVFHAPPPIPQSDPMAATVAQLMREVAALKAKEVAANV